MKAMVTGGAGFIGSHIVESLIKDGIETISYDNYSAGKRENLKFADGRKGLREIKGDVCNYDTLKKYMRNVDIIFHNAASKKNICLKDPQKDLAVNAGGTLNILQLAREYGVRKFVHASTGSVYGESSNRLNPTSYYGVSKLAGERYVAMYSKMGWLDTTILRYFHVYGSRQEDGEYGGVVAIFLKAAKENKNLIIFGDGSQQRSFTHVDDIVKINRVVAEADTNGQVYNCASGIEVSINQLAGKILHLTRSEGRVVYKDWLVGDIKKFDIDNTRIKSLGIKFETDIDRGLRGLC